MKVTPKTMLIFGSTATAVLALGALLYKASIAVQIPARVDRLEASAAEMAKRIDGLSSDITTMRMSQEATARRAEDWQQRMTTVMSEMSGSIRSLTASMESQARDGIRVSEQVKNLQVITDNLQQQGHK